jgi:hypothetical protein
MRAIDVMILRRRMTNTASPTRCRGQSDVPLTAHQAGHDRAISGRWDRRCGGAATPSGCHRR